MRNTSSLDVKRRSFFAYFGKIGLGTTLLPGALWSQSRQASFEITAEMIDHAARLAGLEFSEADRDEMVAGINANLEQFVEGRSKTIDYGVSLPMHFNPEVPGHPMKVQDGPFVASESQGVQRPGGNLEDVAFWSISDMAHLIRTRQVTSVELTRMYLNRLKRYNPMLNCVVTTTDDLAFEQARLADAETAAGRNRGPLHGIPWGAKDLLATRDYPTTWGFEVYRNQQFDMNATVVEKLSEAGAVLIAKLATGELARGDRWFAGQTRNPWAPDHGSGGSSAGPASATSAGLVGFSIGTDTLRSIVIPSQKCGVTGLRPTFGRVSRHGVMPVCWSMDTVGPICRSAKDCAIVFETIRGPDGNDLAVVDRPFAWHDRVDTEGLRVGYLESAYESVVQTEADDSIRNGLGTLEVLRRSGFQLSPIRLPKEAGLDALQIMLVDLATSFDELMHTGEVDLLIQDQEDPSDMLMRISRLFPAVEYLQIHRRRTILMQRMAETFNGIDALIAPHLGSPTFSAAVLTGRPVISLPNGFDDEGKPTGILLVGNPYDEAKLLKIANAVQNATDFHLSHPQI